MPDHETISVQAAASLRILCNEALALNKAINRRSKENLADRYELGKRLEKIKDEIGHGKWLPWLEEHGIDETYSKRCVRLAKSVNLTDLEGEWKTICGVKEPKPATTSGNSGGGVSSSGSTNSDTSGGGTAGGSAGSSTSGPPAPPEPVKDEEGHVVPERLVLTFQGTNKFKDATGLMAKLQSEINEIAQGPAGDQLRTCLNPEKSGDKLLMKSRHLEELKRDVRGTRPYSVCPWCQGMGDGCGKCSGTGWVSKLTWKDIPEDIKGRINV